MTKEEQTEDVTGFVYCPPGWDEQRLRTGQDAVAIKKIAMETYTDIAYIKQKNAIQILGETHDDVYKAQNQLNTLFFPVVVKSKRQWARPDRPGSWGQRRDTLPLNKGGFNQGSSQYNDYSNVSQQQQSTYSDHHLRKMKSESALNERHQAPPTPPSTPPFDQPPRYQSPPMIQYQQQQQHYQPPMMQQPRYQPPAQRLQHRQSYQSLPQSSNNPWGAPSYQLPPSSSSTSSQWGNSGMRRPQSVYGNSNYSSHHPSNSQWR